MQRLKWLPTATPGILASDCGRFRLGGIIYSKDGGLYVRLFDRQTGKEYPCRTIDSAKTRAREILHEKPGLPLWQVGQ